MFSGCTSFGVFVSWFHGSCIYAGMPIFVPSGVGYWIYSSMGVGFTSAVSGDGISSLSMIFDGYFSPSSACPHDLV
jgi:hypothetical protein